MTYNDQVPYDQELAVLCINGGRVQVLPSDDF
jgi:hypothetical protein